MAEQPSSLDQIGDFIDQFSDVHCDEAVKEFPDELPDSLAELYKEAFTLWYALTDKIARPHLSAQEQEQISKALVEEFKKFKYSIIRRVFNGINQKKENDSKVVDDISQSIRKCLSQR